jgi:hypothetical protein
MPDLSLADLARSSDEQFMEQDRLRSQGIPNFDRMPLKFNPQAFAAWLASQPMSQNVQDRRMASGGESWQPVEQPIPPLAAMGTTGLPQALGLNDIGRTWPR